MKRVAAEFRKTIAPLVVLCLFAEQAITSEAGAKPHPQPPPSVLRIGAKEAAWQFRLVVKDGNPDIHPHDPELIAKQRVLDFPRRDQSAWLLLYSVAEVGPRAHTPISRLAIVSERKPHLLVAIPSSEKLEFQGGAAGIVQQADDAMLVEVAPRRFALAISHEGQARIPGRVTLFALSSDFSLKPLWHYYPDEEHKGSIGSTIYFVKDHRATATSLAIRQDELAFEGAKKRLLVHKLFYQLNSETVHYEPAEINPARLTKIIDTAARDRHSLHFRQRGTIGLEAFKEEALSYDRALNEAYARLRRKLSPKARESLEKEQQEWLTKRDGIDDLDDRNKFVADRTRELNERASTR